MTKKPRRIRIRATDHYVVFRLEDEVTIEELTGSTTQRVTTRPRTQLLALAMRSSQKAAAEEQKVA